MLSFIALLVPLAIHARILNYAEQVRLIWSIHNYSIDQELYSLTVGGDKVNLDFWVPCLVLGLERLPSHKGIKNMMSPLDLAVYNCQSDYVVLLLENGASLKGQFGLDALYLASLYASNEGILDYLVKRWRISDYKDGLSTPLMAIMENGFNVLSALENPDIVKSIPIEDDSGNTALRMSLLNVPFSAHIMECLLKHGANIDAVGKDGMNSIEAYLGCKTESFSVNLRLCKMLTFETKDLRQLDPNKGQMWKSLTASVERVFSVALRWRHLFWSLYMLLGSPGCAMIPKEIIGVLINILDGLERQLFPTFDEACEFSFLW